MHSQKQANGPDEADLHGEGLLGFKQSNSHMMVMKLYCC